jgi:hypothetical protein
MLDTGIKIGYWRMLKIQSFQKKKLQYFTMRASITYLILYIQLEPHPLTCQEMHGPLEPVIGGECTSKSYFYYGVDDGQRPSRHWNSIIGMQL